MKIVCDEHLCELEPVEVCVPGDSEPGTELRCPNCDAGEEIEPPFHLKIFKPELVPA